MIFVTQLKGQHNDPPRTQRNAIQCFHWRLYGYRRKPCPILAIGAAMIAALLITALAFAISTAFAYWLAN
jgi:hypothetical protein